LELFGPLVAEYVTPPSPISQLCPASHPLVTTDKLPT